MHLFKICFCFIVIVIGICEDKEMLLLHMKVDLVVTLGGDGTVLWVRKLFGLLQHN